MQESDREKDYRGVAEGMIHHPDVVGAMLDELVVALLDNGKPVETLVVPFSQPLMMLSSILRAWNEVISKSRPRIVGRCSRQ